ncbi:hypothetical protein LTR09_012165 [Extremus antarcticus]|uniref:Serine hydrolase domain-containing protein n=1 Tax=Extremus antarcticus TaxID=702011 RepID=A0AAJ0DAD8_9PEZI|nr:hypothetical protein LTR09_012165 [Extremus antarcticus]
MRILCLHGYGTSGDIMKLQLDAFIRQADASYEFVFLGGEFECPKAKGIGNLYDGPTFCFMESVRPHDVRNALDYLEHFVVEEGPFDGLIGFSQGASLALTYLLQHATDTSSGGDSDAHNNAFALKWAVFLSAIPAFSADASFNADLYRNLTDHDRALLEDFPYNNADIDFEAFSGQPRRAIAFQSFATMFDGCLSAEVVDQDYDHGFDPLKHNYCGADRSVPRIMHPELLPADVRIRIPTVHVTGVKDERDLIASSRLMERVCEPKLVQSLTHSGGHDVPRTMKDSRALVKAVDYAIRQSVHDLQ